MLQPLYLRQFEKDITKSIKRKKNIQKLKTVITVLCEGHPLPAKNRSHKLKGEYDGYWECHIEPDWLLIYKITGKELIKVSPG